MSEAPYSQQPSFEAFIEKERTRLTKAREDVVAKRAELDKELEKIDQEMAAIAAYDAVKKGKAVPTAAPKQAGSRRPRRAGVRDAVLQTIQQHPEGINRAGLLEAHGAKGDKSAEQSISNALAALKKQGTIDLNDGIYTVSTASQ